MIWVTSNELYMGSGISSLRGAAPRRGISGLLLGAVAATSLLAIIYRRRVERATNDFVAHAWKVLNPPASDKNNGVLLKVVAFARDVGGDLDARRKANTRYATQSRVRLLGSHGEHARANTTALRGTLKRWRFTLSGFGLAALADQLLDRGHDQPHDLAGEKGERESESALAKARRIARRASGTS